MKGNVKYFFIFILFVCSILINKKICINKKNEFDYVDVREYIKKEWVFFFLNGKKYVIIIFFV